MVGSRLVQLGKGVVVYGLSGVIIQALSVLTTPIYTKVFSTSDYGVLEVVTTTLSLLSILALFSFDSAAQRSYYDYPEDKRSKRNAVISTAIVSAVVWSSAILVLLFVSSGFWTDKLFTGKFDETLIRVALLSLPLGAAMTIIREITRLTNRPWRFLKISIVASVVNVVVALTSILVLHSGVMGIFVGTIVGALVGIGLGIFYGRKSLTAHFSTYDFGIMVRFSAPLIPAALAMWGLSLIDRFFLLHYSSLDQIGLYSVANRVANLLLLLVTAVGAAWSPFIFSLLSSRPDEEREVRSPALTYIALILTSVGLALALFAKEILSVFTSSAFVPAYSIVWILVLWTIILGINSITITGISIARQTKYFAIYTIGAVALNLILNQLLIPPYGIVGASWATVLSVAALGLAYLIKAQELSPVEYNYRKLGTILVAYVLLAPFGAIDYPNLAVDLMVKLGLLGLFILLMYVLKVFSRPEIEFVQRRLAGFWTRQNKTK